MDVEIHFTSIKAIGRIGRRDEVAGALRPQVNSGRGRPEWDLSYGAVGPELWVLGFVISAFHTTRFTARDCESHELPSC